MVILFGLMLIVTVLALLLWVEALSKKSLLSAEIDRLRDEVGSCGKKIKAARKDSIERSYATLKGRLMETLTPYVGTFPWNPRDCRFIGSPVDYIVFDKLSEEGEVSIVFLEVKTGRSRLTKRERSVRDAILKGRITFEELRPDQLES